MIEVWGDKWSGCIAVQQCWAGREEAGWRAHCFSADLKLVPIWFSFSNGSSQVSSLCSCGIHAAVCSRSVSTITCNIQAGKGTPIILYPGIAYSSCSFNMYYCITIQCLQQWAEPFRMFFQVWEVELDYTVHTWGECYKRVCSLNRCLHKHIWTSVDTCIS
jgi:hypothetical protein